MSMITFNQLDVRTKDSRYTQKDLIRIINKISKSRGHDSKVTESVVNSFVTNGIIETYNELGYQKWIEMIHQIVDHEISEGRM